MRFKTKFTLSETEYHKEWFNFYPKWDYMRLTITKSFYFDPRPKIITHLTTLIMLIGVFFTGFSLWSFIWLPFLFKAWGEIYITLPLDSGVYDECEWESYGFYFYHIDTSKLIFNELVLEVGKKWSYRLEMPWYYKWYRTSILLKNNEWEHEKVTDPKRKSFYEDHWKAKQKVYSYDYVDSFDKQVIPTKIYVEEREWRPILFFKIPLFKKIQKTIDVHFSQQVGSRKGSWKGGCLECSYILKEGEHPLQCIKRMESERRF